MPIGKACPTFTAESKPHRQNNQPFGVGKGGTCSSPTPGDAICKFGEGISPSPTADNVKHKKAEAMPRLSAWLPLLDLNQ